MWPNSLETEQLLKAAGKGRNEAVNALLERHRESLRRMIRARIDPVLGRRIDASDVVQDVLLEASQRLQDYLQDPKLPFGLWLRHLARDRMIDLHRRHRLAARRSIDREQSLNVSAENSQSSLDLMAMLVNQDLTPAAASLKKELEQQFLAAVEQLEEHDRDMILMRHFEGLSNSEVADLLELSPSAAGMRYLRALRRLRLLLGQPEDTSSAGG